MKANKLSDNVIRLDVNGKDVQILWIADAHTDSLHVYRTRIKAMMNNYPNAYIVMGGDFSDNMQNVGDKRATKGEDRYNRPQYLNSIIDDLYDFYSLYAERILSFNLGNHESAAIRHHGFDVQLSLVSLLNAQHKTNIQIGDFAGYVRLVFTHNASKKYQYLIYYSHKPISINSKSTRQILAARYPSANMYITEHIHQPEAIPFKVETVNFNDRVEYYTKWYIKAPTLKAEHEGVKRGYHHEKNYEPTFPGALLLNFHTTRSYQKTKDKMDVIVKPEFIEI